MGADPSLLLRDHGLRVTAQRVAVLRAVAQEPHTTANAVVSTVERELGSVSVQAVYDCLSTLAERGLLRRIQPAGSPARYEHRVGDNHHHLVCRVCDRIVDVDCALDAAPCLRPAQQLGYEVDEAEVIYWGRCRDCQDPRSQGAP